MVMQKYVTQSTKISTVTDSFPVNGSVPAKIKYLENRNVSEIVVNAYTFVKK